MLARANTSSEFKPRIWIGGLLFQLLIERKSSGPVFCNINGDKIPPAVMNKTLKVKQQRPDLVVCDEDNIWEPYSIGSSCRRGSQSRVREERVHSTVIDLVNRWQKDERAKGGNP